MWSKVQLLLLFAVSNCAAYVVFLEPHASTPQEDLQEPSREEMPLHRRKKSIILGFNEKVEEVCKSKVRHNYRPEFGHIANGSRVQIKQDEENFLETTFIECLGENRPSCHGIDHGKFSSECVTVYEHRPAFVRVVKSGGDYFEATVRVPIMCECRLRRHVIGFQKR